MPDTEEEPTPEQLRLEEEIQDSINQQVIDESNAMLLAEEEAGEQAPRTSTPSTPPLQRPEEGLPVDPDLLSPYLNRLRIDLPHESDDGPTT